MFVKVPYACFFILISTNVGKFNLQDQSGLSGLSWVGWMEILG